MVDIHFMCFVCTGFTLNLYLIFFEIKKKCKKKYPAAVVIGTFKPKSAYDDCSRGQILQQLS